MGHQHHCWVRGVSCRPVGQTSLSRRCFLRRLKTASWITTLMTSMVQLHRMIMQSLQHRREQGQQQSAQAVAARAREQPQLLRRVMLRALSALKQPCCRS